MTDLVEPSAAYDAAFARGEASTIDDDAAPEPFDVALWQRPSDAADHALFVSRCTGPTLDVGCGPGRLVGELTNRGLTSLGIDVSPEAVRQARNRGAQALCLDVFDTVPDEGSWRWALLADGNVGIGGDPVRLLRRVAELLHEDGAMVVEVGPPGVGFQRVRRRLVVDGTVSDAFDWAVVSVDVIEQLAHEAGLVVFDHRAHGARHAVTLLRA